MNIATWYEVCVVDTLRKNEQIDNSAVGTLEQAKRAVTRFSDLYLCYGIMIFVRQHTRGRHGFRVLHKLTQVGD